MGIITWLVVGLIAGWLASMIMKTDGQQGPVMDIVMGVVGAIAGGFIMNQLGYAGASGFDLYSIGVATLGAVVVIAIGRMIKK